MRALKSPAISDRASVISVVRKLSLNPRTPTSAATPTATESTTNANLPGADFKIAPRDCSGPLSNSMRGQPLCLLALE